MTAARTLPAESLDALAEVLIDVDDRLAREAAADTADPQPA